MAMPAVAPVLRVVPEGALQAAEAAAAQKKAQESQQLSEVAATNLAGFIRQQYEMMRVHRNSASGWNERLLAALRTFNGSYDPQKLAEIQQFQGSTIYARIIAMKCRGASSLLRDVYLAPDRPWGIAAPADPDVPEEIVGKITQMVSMEAMTLDQGGQPIDLMAIRDRIDLLMSLARDAAKRKSTKQAKVVEDKLDELLIEGRFYNALAEFLVDLPIFPFACLKGPIVKIMPTIKWVNGTPTPEQKPKLYWARISPFDIWWTPGVSDIEDASVIERQRLTRAELNDLLDLPGYNQKEIRAVLDEYGRGGLNDTWDSTDSERAVQENKENPHWNRSGLITCLEWHGNVQGLMLLQYGMDPKQIQDPLRDYMVQAWLIGTHVIKCQLTPSPRKRHPYFITSFEKVPGTILGNALPDILSDIGDAANATMRALVNNLSMASGPQVVVNDDRLAPDEDGESMYPWKRWHVKADPMGGAQEEPIKFFMPDSRAAELLNVYKELNQMADELSAIPKSLTGANPGSGAGRTASGLAMLMGNASKILQTVAANVDRDVLSPLLNTLFELLMLTDKSGLLTGEEEIRVLGVSVAVQRETERSRQLEFLTATANPVDMGIMGPTGRAVVLGAVASTLGLDGQKVVPSPEEMEEREKQQAMQAALPPGPGGPVQPGNPPGNPTGQGEQQSPNATHDMGPRTNLMVQKPQPRVAGGVG